MTEQQNDGDDRPDAKAAWSEAGERLSGLGSRLRQHYQQHAQAPSEQTGAEVKDAAKRLNQAVHSAFEALASASKDQAVKDDARRAGRSVGDALAGTFAGISQELSKTFSGSSRSEPADAPLDPASPDYGSPERPAPGAPAGPPAGSAPGVPDPGTAGNGAPQDPEPGHPA